MAYIWSGERTGTSRRSAAALIITKQCFDIDFRGFSDSPLFGVQGHRKQLGIIGFITSGSHGGRKGTHSAKRGGRHEDSWDFMESHENPWDAMRNHMIAWNLIGFHGITWVFHGVPWNPISMVSHVIGWNT